MDSVTTVKHFSDFVKKSFYEQAKNCVSAYITRGYTWDVTVESAQSQQGPCRGQRLYLPFA